MPNYEIYTGDILNIIQGVTAQFQLIQVDSTDFHVRRTGSKYEVVRDHLPVGRLHIKIAEDRALSMGEMFVVEQYRSRGVSQLLMQIAIVHGVLQGATGARLAEEVVNAAAQNFFAHYGLQFREQPSSLAVALAGAEETQTRLAARLGLARSPNTLLLNTDRPAGAVVGRARSSSLGGK